MFNFTFTSLVMTLISTNLVIILMYFIMKKETIFYKIGIPLLCSFFIVTGLRMLFPFEILPIAQELLFSESISKYIVAFLRGRFLDNKISFWNIIQYIWLIGSIILLLHYVKGTYRFHKFIFKYGKVPSETSLCAKCFCDIKEEIPQANSVELLTLPQINVPMVYGLKNPKILLPDSLRLSEKEFYFVYKHELSHYLHHDLYLKLGMLLLHIVYWWNPVCYLLKKQSDLLLEMRVDTKITDSNYEKAAYMQCLLNIAKNAYAKKCTPNGISLCSGSSSFLKKRFQMLINNHYSSNYKSTHLLILIAIIFVYIGSYIYIFEPYYANPDDLAGCNVPTLENSYMTLNEDGTYSFYLEGNFICITNSTRYYLDGTPIYKNKEEAIVYEK